jgi:FlaA1/EpsC-like NDP-sugar epimerase
VNSEFPASQRHSGVCSWAEILGRAAINPGPISIPRVAGRRVMVTGAGGFIGSGMVRLLAASGAARVILLEVAEQALLAMAGEMEARGYGERCVPVAGSVCDEGLLATLFEEHRPELVIHAGALKQVPLMERNPVAAVETNALGTWLLARLCAEFGVRQMILVSTDKAVAPRSIMGASKRIAELAVLQHSEFATAVRLVNVIGSPYSVTTIFTGQIAQGGPVTVTHPAAQRYFLTLEEVMGLLADAIDWEMRGIAAPEPGEPVFITDLAKRMIGTSGSNVTIVFTEPRPGDKLNESLLGARERLTGDAPHRLRSVTSPAAVNLDAQMRALQAVVAARDLASVLEVVAVLVPDYEPSALVRDAAREAGIPSR